MRFIKRLVSLGVDETVSDFDAQRIRMLNIGVLMGVSLALTTVPLVLFLGGVETLPGTAILLIVALLVFSFQSRQRPEDAALVLSLLGVMLVTGQFFYVGPELGVHYWLLGLILFPFLFFPRKSRVLPLALGFLTTADFWILAILDRVHHEYVTSYLITQLLSSLLILGLGFTLRFLIMKVEDRIEEQAGRIAEQRRVIEQYPEQNPNAVLRLDGDGRLAYANPPGLRLTSQIGLKYGDLFSMNSNLKLDLQMPEAVEEITVGNRTYRFKIAAVAEYGFFNFYGTDITPYKELETARAEVARALDREREVSRLKEEFLASMSHELRTPLNAVLGLSEALQEEVYGPLSEKQGESLQTIWNSGQALLTMFDDLLDFSRIGAGRYPTMLAPVDLRMCLQMVVRRHTRSVSQEGLRLAMDEGDEEAVAMVDMRHVQRILNMLLENAIKFTPKGGQVGIELGPGTQSGWLQIVVWDTGIGIPKEKQAQLFDPFVQIEGGLSRRYGGTGLGLALTSRLVRLLGARLDVESEEGEGSRFILHLSKGLPNLLLVFSDLGCPFCYVLSEWLVEANIAHLIDWRGVEQSPGFSGEGEGNTDIWVELKAKLERVGRMAPGIDISMPPERSNTRRAMAVLERIRTTEPGRVAEARRLLYRSIWTEGQNLTEWSAVTDVLKDFSLGTLDDEIPEMQMVIENTAEWQKQGEGQIPMLVGRSPAKVWHGLGVRADILDFVETQLSAE